MKLIIPRHNILFKKSIFNNLQEYRIPNYPDSIFYHKNGKIFFELNTKNNVLYCDNNRVWYNFSEQGLLKYFETQRVIMNEVVQHTNWGSVIPNGDKYVITERWNNIQIKY